ncbi:MAG: extracellular solute-binding protein [Aggregatilineales bacterium]
MTNLTRHIHRILHLAAALLTLAACGPSAAPLTPAAAAQPTDTPALAATATPTLAATNTPAPAVLSVWWPEPLAPLDNSAAADLLSEQISGFQAAQGGDVQVDLRLKREGDLGGIMATLRAASPVAPGALPDLTLLPRSDLLAAVQDGLVFPLEGLVSSAVLGDLFEPALRLGQVDGLLYGVPYALAVEHMAYRRADETPLSWRFADVLARGAPYAFPAAPPAGISRALFSQYLDAGGTLDASNHLEVNAEALRTVLVFYQEATAAGVLSPAVLAYARPTDYRADLVAGALDAGVVSSTLYLTLLEEGAALQFGPLPTESGGKVSALDGWLWALTTASADRQALAARFLNWMMNASRQGQYTHAVHMLPSQRAAFQQWPAAPYTAFARELLAAATPYLADNANHAAARALQTAMIEVIDGQKDAAAAVEGVLDQLGGQ